MATKKTRNITDTNSKRKTIEQRVKDLAADLGKLTITDAASSVTASQHLREAAILKRDIEAEYKKRREPHVKAQREIIAEEKELTRQLDAAINVVSKAIKEFQRKEAEARAAREQAEREKREAQAREEAALRAEQLRAAAASAPPNVAKRLEEQAQRIETATPIIDPIETEEKPQMLAEGMHTRKSHHAAVHDFKKLVLQVAAGIMLKEYAASLNPHLRVFLSNFKPNAQATIEALQPSMPRLNDLAKAFPNDLELEGVTVEEDESFVARR